ncbi:dual specificity protein phosphatase 23 [Hyalella azteca]|uniref:Dual specificity protein phosphatase 23 n=1 Tax=Hyalella azteca TaxID=294128 RepID=A0A8B7P961_HYAAZ|nr:dual specificity protein phosphatase 23 [Hyalella azteca]
MAAQPYNFSWMVPGEICACARPDRRAHAQFLRDAGVRYVVCLSDDLPPAPYPDLHIQTIPVEEFEPPTLDQIHEFIGICELARARQVAVCVHCRMGRGRTGVMLACYLIRYQGQVPQQAISNVRFKRPYSIETWEQEFVVKDYYDHWTKVRTV